MLRSSPPLPDPEEYPHAKAVQDDATYGAANGTTDYNILVGGFGRIVSCIRRGDVFSSRHRGLFRAGS